MQLARHNFLAILLIIGVLVSTIPFSVLHQHEAIQCVEHTEDVDPCHYQIYHGHFSVQESCEHNTHVYSEIEKCEWCKFVKPFRDEFSNYIQSEYDQCIVESELFTELNLTLYYSVCLFKPGRAPPIS